MVSKGLDLSLYNDFSESNYEYSKLFDRVSDRGLYEQPDPLRRELIFYYGHTVAFTRSKLIQAGALLESHPFDELFERGVSPDSSSDLDDFGRVDLEVLRDYKKKFTSEVIEMFMKGAFKDDFLSYAFKMGIEHEKLHLQTTYPHIVKLSDELKKPRSLSAIPLSSFEGVQGGFIKFESGRVLLGRGDFVESYEDFMWDNEQGQILVNVSDFEVSRYPVTNGQVLEFIREGGYGDDSLWLGVKDFEGHVDRIRERGMPFNFICDNGSFRYKTLDRTLGDIPSAWPAMLNRYEANAVARFYGGRPISEVEWFYIHQDSEVVGGGSEYIPLDVREVPTFAVGNIGTWTCSDFRPICDLDNFEISNLYPDFSMEWFNEKHGVIKGASFMGRGNMMNTNFRDFMQNMMDYPASTYIVREL